MKVMLVSFNKPMLVDVVYELNKQGVDIVYWIVRRGLFVQKNVSFNNTIFHDAEDALQAKPAEGVDLSKFEPVNPELTEQLSIYLANTLLMMESFDINGSTNLSKKLHLYYEYVNYWYNVLVQYKPDAVLFVDVPHVCFHFVIYNIAKLLKIKVVLYRILQIPGRIIFFDDYKDFKEIQIKLENQSQDVMVQDLSKDILNYYQAQILDKTKHDVPLYAADINIKRLKKTSNLFPDFSIIIKRILSGSFLKIFWGYFLYLFKKKKVVDIEDVYLRGIDKKLMIKRWKNNKNQFRNEYLSLQIPPDYNRKYIYVPLHNQPEANCNPLGGQFFDLIRMVDILSASIPNDWYVYIKESPFQWVAPRTQLGRYRGYYKELLKRKNVILVQNDTSTYELIKNAQTVATVSGTAGWEALFYGKPSLIFGYVWYMYCSGVFRIRSLGECRLAIKKIIEGAKPDQQGIIKFLDVIDKLSVKGFVNRKWKEVFKHGVDVTYEENIKNIAEAFYKRCL